MFQFLSASSHFYKRSCPSVGWSVGHANIWNVQDDWFWSISSFLSPCMPYHIHLHSFIHQKTCILKFLIKRGALIGLNLALFLYNWEFFRSPFHAIESVSSFWAAFSTIASVPSGEASTFPAHRRATASFQIAWTTILCNREKEWYHTINFRTNRFDVIQTFCL